MELHSALLAGQFKKGVHERKAKLLVLYFRKIGLDIREVLVDAFVLGSIVNTYKVVVPNVMNHRLESICKAFVPIKAILDSRRMETDKYYPGRRSMMMRPM